MSHPNVPEPNMLWPIIRAAIVVAAVLFLVSSCLSSVHRAAHPEPNPVYQWERDRIVTGASIMTFLYVVTIIVVCLGAAAYLKESWDGKCQAYEQKCRLENERDRERQQAESRRLAELQAEQQAHVQENATRARIAGLRRQIAEHKARENECEMIAKLRGRS
ncbi:MAG: hypothetical protein ABL901_05375 [Hyphomicrobiaceae bacterium]